MQLHDFPATSKVDEIDSKRMLIRVEQGKECNARLSPQLLALVRQ